VLGGTGRLEGTSRGSPPSFELVLGSCPDGDGMIWLPPSHRLVTVTADSSRSTMCPRAT